MTDNNNTTDFNDQNLDSDAIHDPNSEVETSDNATDFDHENDDDDYNDFYDEDDGERDSDDGFIPSVGQSSGGLDVTGQLLDKYNTEADDEAIKNIQNEWKKDKRKNKKISGISVLVILAVLIILPWYVWGLRQDLVYFFSPSDPIDLGDAQAYRLAQANEETRPEDFLNNRYVKISGIPIRHVGIQVKENAVAPKKKKFIYQLLGSSVYVQEDMEDSRIAAFMSKTSATMNANAVVEQLDVSGRLRRFDSNSVKQYAPIRDYYTSKYHTIFCEGMSQSERNRKAALLGRGGIALQIMPDGAVIQSETGTHVTLRDVVGLRGRSAIAIGDNNVVLHSTDAGLTWQKSDLPLETQATSVIYEPEASQIVFGGRQGWVGSESFKPSDNALRVSQDVLDIAFTQPEPGDVTSPRMIAVGREGLLQVAYLQREGWSPARIDDSIRFNDVLRTQDKWFVAGDRLLTSDSTSFDWQSASLPQKSTWFSLTEIPGAVIATGSKGALAKYDLKAEHPVWEEWPSDDVPGIEFDANIQASAISDDGKTWVGVGSKGAILVSKADENGQFSPVQRISGTYAGYGVVQDILNGYSVESSIHEALQRYTEEDLYDVTYHNGMFYAVGSESLLMMSKDGYSWTKRPLHIKHKNLYTIAFTGPTTGVIGGEKGTMLVTDDDGAIWRSKKAPSERSIYKIATSPNFPEGFVFAGAYGLWGYCKGVNATCTRRSSNSPNHYRSIALDTGKQNMGYLRVVVGGDDAHIDKIDDTPEREAPKQPLWQQARSVVTDMAFAEQELPLLPDAARGKLGLIAAGSGTIYRSIDAGYTFQREDTGLAAPISHIALSKNGDIAIAFDGLGNAVQSLHGVSKWTPLSIGFVDGEIVGTITYLVDRECIYRMMPGSNPQKLACVEAPLKLQNISIDNQQIYVGAVNENRYELLALNDDKLESQAVIPAQALAPNAKILTCQGQMAVVLPDTHQWMSADATQDNVADAKCLDGKWNLLKSHQPKPGIWNLAVTNPNPIWHMEVGFNTDNARMARLSDGRWWMAAEAADANDPLILMSSDAKSWSWRRDRITDFHAVATAGAYAVAVGDKGTILVSEDYGASWSRQSTTATTTLRDVCLSSDGSFALAVGDGGTIYRADNGLSRWVRIKYNFDFDITSCTIAEYKDRFQVYFAGEGGAIYVAPRDFKGLDLVSSTALENLYAMTTLETGEVLAVGGVYQSPDTICEEGFLLEADKSPKSLWLSLFIALGLAVIWAFVLRRLILGWIHRKDLDEDEFEVK